MPGGRVLFIYNYQVYPLLPAGAPPRDNFDRKRIVNSFEVQVGESER